MGNLAPLSFVGCLHRCGNAMAAAWGAIRRKLDQERQEIWRDAALLLDINALQE
ncbi:hypothetical protein [Xanthomonas campestris]|uniref:hypothetical protein n=1 Tax=Xanthomonas campestris TaxID=339 RepID=UPI002359321D|nr:hypothetical protein [Xanthomonas campestris]